MSVYGRRMAAHGARSRKPREWVERRRLAGHIRARAEAARSCGTRTSCR